jgi:hypothetical protein
VHGLWHAVLLVAILLGSAGAAIVLLAPLLFGNRSVVLARARPVVVGVLIAAAALLVLEWLVVHGRSL